MNGWEFMGSLFQVFSWYISKLFYPQGIVMAWATPILHDHILLNVIGAFMLIALLLLLFARFKEKICRFALVLIVLGFLPICLAAFRLYGSGAMIEPHWLIFSSIGFFILAAYFCFVPSGTC